MGQDQGSSSSSSSTGRLDFESHLELKQIAEDVYTNIHQPWVFHITHTLPGPLMMAQAALAASKTVPEGFMLNSLQTHFMLGPSAQKPMVYTVRRLSQGRRFAVRSVDMSQDGRVMVSVTASFLSGTPWTGQAMVHAERRRTGGQLSSDQGITLDDFRDVRTELGPFMKSQRLPHVVQEPRDASTTIAPVAAQIDPPIKSPAGSLAHHLAVIYVSDYHVMDCPLTIHGVDCGLFAIDDHDRTRTSMPAMKVMTSLNHTVHFHVHDGFRADELMYIEVSSPWARDGRAMVHSRIFSHQGVLVATCVQEAFYVFKDNAKL